MKEEYRNRIEKAVFEYKLHCKDATFEEALNESIQITNYNFNTNIKESEFNEKELTILKSRFNEASNIQR